jgi:hypothetical protein
MKKKLIAFDDRHIKYLAKRDNENETVRNALDMFMKTFPVN